MEREVIICAVNGCEAIAMLPSTFDHRAEFLPAYANGIRDLVARYDAFVLDQWGVLHDGNALYPGVLTVLSTLKAMSKPVVVLTNSRKRASHNVARLERLGVTRDMYATLISSAEVLRTLLDARPYPPWSALGSRAYVVALDEDKPLLAGLPYRHVADVTEADFVILLSTPPDRRDADHTSWLQRAADRGLTVVTSSAEPMTLTTAGLGLGLEGLTTQYAALGGTVINVGKPNPLVYDDCARFLVNIERARTLAIGDQVASDVVGAKRNGYHAALVMTGAASPYFAHVRTAAEALTAAKAITDYDVELDWVISELHW